MNKNNYIFMNIACLLSYLFKKIGAVVVCILVCGIGLDVYRTVTYQPQYLASMDVALKLEQNTYSQLQAAQSYVKTLEYILNGKVVKNDIAKKMEVDSVHMTCRVASQNNTNLVTLQVYAPTKKEAYYSLKYLTQWYVKNGEQYHLSYELDALEDIQLHENAINPNNHLHNLRSGMLYSCVLIIFIFAIIVYFKPTIKSSDDIERYLDCRLFAKIPRERKKGKGQNRKKAILISSLKTSFVYKEAIKKLRNRFELSTQKHDYHTIMITSTLENEGKSTIAVNLALSLCQNGHKVLIIDSDLRKPSLHKILNLKTKRNINNYFHGKEKWETQVQYLQNNELFVLCAKQDLQNAEKMIDEKMKILIEEAQKDFDYVIIDTSPSFGINEPVMINEWVDASLLVVKQNGASTRMINETITKLVQSKNNLIGCIYNASVLDITLSNKVYGYRYGYNRYSRDRRE